MQCYAVMRAVYAGCILGLVLAAEGSGRQTASLQERQEPMWWGCRGRMRLAGAF